MSMHTENLFTKHTLTIGQQKETPFKKDIGIYQDGTTPLYRDTDGSLWAMSGHSHAGHIGMFKGTTLDDMTQLYPIETNFCVGHADYAFSGIPYPEGVKARGSIWPFGLYICPNTHRFFCFFHNESGWNGKGTAYDALGPCEVPHYDSDFRHIGLMHSDDEGRTWTFDRWVLTAEKVCFTELYNPGAGRALGQKAGLTSLGSGDFTLYVEPGKHSLTALKDEKVIGYLSFTLQKDNKTDVVLLEDGTYTVSVAEKGAGVELHLTLNEEKGTLAPTEAVTVQKPSTPQTGDNTNLSWWWLLAVLSATCIVVLETLSRKKKSLITNTA